MTLCQLFGIIFFMNTYDISEIKNIKVHGRTSKKSPYTLFWTASMIEMNVKASELWVELYSDYEELEQWITVLINDSFVSRQMLLRGKQDICVFRSFDSSKVKNIKIIKDTQAMSGNQNTYITFTGIKTDASVDSFLPVEDRKLKIEVIGDSITSGEGIYGAHEEMEWIAMWFAGSKTYEYQLARKLNADLRVFSQSGWGIYCSWDNNLNCALRKYYEEVCSLDNGERSIEKGSHDKYDFASWQPDFVIVNLGTNDGGAFTNAEWKDEKTGIVYKQRLNSDGSFNKEDQDKVSECTDDFLQKIRKDNPKAKIIWVYGMLGNPMKDALLKGIDTYKSSKKDSDVFFVELEDSVDETYGSRGHPGPIAHENTANRIYDFLMENNLVK